eukprot:TRINITY_DN4882_c0_g2_i1.p1 TRINITY_DN4882_c0_g2~~TRINITY_DN4882_c0_g2_i1.p1  ORF type:complete len:247 (-),score=56.22 TRINITY_DN4882_c0_g2_i1:1336-2076(-)
MDIEKERERWLELLELESENSKVVEEIKPTETLEEMGYAITKLVPIKIELESNPHVIFGRLKPLQRILKAKAAHAEISSRISIGDRVSIHYSDALLAAKNCIGTGRIVDADSKEITIQIKQKNCKSFAELFKKCQSEEPVQIDVFMSPDYVTYKRCKKAIRDVFIRSEEMPYLHAVLLGLNKPRTQSIPIPVDPLLSKLNEFQVAAVKGALEARDVYLIHGPPGTGKTLTLSVYIGMVRAGLDCRR